MTKKIYVKQGTLGLIALILIAIIYHISQY